MRFSIATALLAGASMTSAATLPTGPVATGAPAPALPVSSFRTSDFKPLPVEEILHGGNQTQPAPAPSNGMGIQATCGNPRIRREWDNYPTASRQNFVNSIRCLMNRPASGQFAQSRSRYEDLVALHQNLKNNVHENSKFLVWHRYYLWTFESILRSECGFTADLPWFDETKYAGRFSQSSIFSAQWFGSIAINGCVTNGQFANLAINVGPGTQNIRHCLARRGDGALTAQCSSANVNGCNNRGGYADMAACAEGGAHAFGHNGVGMVMQDPFAAPADPFFWLHHAFIDRNYRVWQNRNGNRVTSIDGTDAFGRRLTLDMGINVAGLRPDVRIRDVLNTLDTTLCYRYDY